MASGAELPAAASEQALRARDGGRFVLVWSDDFDGPDVDTARWYVLDEHQDAWPESPWRRNWKASNVSIEDGALVIRTIKDGEGYSTGAVRTAGYGETPTKFEQAFGRFEARMRFPKQPGHWAAFWLMNKNVGNVDGSGRDGTEIDILEKAYLTDRGNHALHWDGYGEAHQSASQDFEGFGLNDGWHTATLEWYPDRYIFFIDGKETWSTTAGGVCQTPNYVKLTEEIGNFGPPGPKSWGTGPISEAQLPDYFYIDYVRVWRYDPP